MSTLMLNFKFDLKCVQKSLSVNLKMLLFWNVCYVFQICHTFCKACFHEVWSSNCVIALSRKIWKKELLSTNIYRHNFFIIWRWNLVDGIFLLSIFESMFKVKVLWNLCCLPVHLSIFLSVCLLTALFKIHKILLFA